MPIATFHMLPSPSRLQEQKTKRAMNLSVNGQSQVPPGFRFHPTEEELLQYYLKKKVASLQIDLDVIQDIDLNKLEPWDIQEKCRIGSAPQTDWYFFSHKDKKYPTGTRTNRATAAGFWKATGRDKVICSSSSRIGMRKTLVFYTGRAPHGEKSDWIMHEYRLDDNTLDHNGSNLNGDQSGAAEEGWVVCRVFRKKNYVKALDSPANCSSKTSMDLRTHMLNSPTHDLNHILSYMGKTTTTNAAASTTSKDESKRSLPNAFTKTTNMRYLELDPMESFMHLPQLESPIDHQHDQMMINYAPPPSASTWAELDRLVAYQLNGQAAAEANSESTRQLSCLKNDSTGDNSIMPFCFTGDTDTTTTTTTATTTLEHLLRSQSSHVYESEAAINDDQFWSFTKQSSASTSLDPILHFSV